VVTNYKLGQFKLDYEEYQKLKVMFQFINPDFSRDVAGPEKGWEP
jgi:hypothetical protein